MGRKVWRWIVIGLFALLALAISGAIALNTLGIWI